MLICVTGADVGLHVYMYDQIYRHHWRRVSLVEEHAFYFFLVCRMCRFLTLPLPLCILVESGASS